MDENINVDPATNQGEATAAKAEEKQFTQSDVNNIVAKEAKKAQEKIFKELGLGDDIKGVKDGLERFNTWKESQKTQEQLHSDSVSAITKERDEARAEIEKLQRHVYIRDKNIFGDDSVRYEKLAVSYMDEDTDFYAAFDKALKDFPISKGVPGSGGNPPPPNKQTQTNRYEGVTII